MSILTKKKKKSIFYIFFLIFSEGREIEKFQLGTVVKEKVRGGIAAG